MLKLFNIRRIFDSKQYNNASHDFVGNGYSQFFFNREKHAPPALHGFKLIIIVIKQVVGPDCKTVSKRIENIEEIRAYFKLGYSSWVEKENCKLWPTCECNRLKI